VIAGIAQNDAPPELAARMWDRARLADLPSVPTLRRTVLTGASGCAGLSPLTFAAFVLAISIVGRRPRARLPASRTRRCRASLESGTASGRRE
jgi:hypothetical protein